MAVPERAASPLVVFLFLLLATFTQVLLALYGLLSRYLQVRENARFPSSAAAAAAAAAASGHVGQPSQPTRTFAPCRSTPLPRCPPYA